MKSGLPNFTEKEQQQASAANQTRSVRNSLLSNSNHHHHHHNHSHNHHHHGISSANPNINSNNNTKSRHNNRKFQKLKLKTIAADYLNNCIQLNDENDLKTSYFDKLLQNQFNCFLHLNKINCEPEQQNEFFNYYKTKQNNENQSRNRLDQFLQAEFSNDNPESAYIDILLSKTPTATTTTNVPRPTSAEKAPQKVIPSINIVLPGSKKTSLCESEFDFAHKAHLSQAATEYADLAPSNLTLSSTPSSTNSTTNLAKLPTNTTVAVPVSARLRTNLSQKAASPMAPKETQEQQLNSLKLNSNNNLIYQRTISESSNESSMVILNSSSSRNLGGSSLVNNRSLNGTNKSTFFSNLKRLTNEKLLLTSNSSPIGMISRLPFRLYNIKSDLNESFMSRNRHMVQNKPIHNQNSFLIDVFDLLELDIEDYINTGSMSYASLIDRKQKKAYDETQQLAKLKEQAAEAGTLMDGDEETYDDFDENEDNIRDESIRKESKAFGIQPYQADYLDDPQLTEMTAGKNRTCLKFASYAVSIIDYVKPLDLKKEINETFKEKFPYIQISLTKLRSIKRELLEIAHETSLDFIIVAQSYIYFEKLILQGLINKSNRKHLAANCLILAAKLNDTTKKEVSKLIDTIMAKFRFDSRKEMIAFEFPVLVALEFNLIINYENEFGTHYERLIASLDSLKSFRQRTFSD